MEYLGEHFSRKVYWWNFSEKNYDELPDSNWVCFAIEDGLPDEEIFERFVKASVRKNILEFKVFGKLSAHLDTWFDSAIVKMKIKEYLSEKVFVMTTWHDKETLANAFWQCFGATCLPDETDYDNIKIVCFHFDNIDKRDELKTYLEKFNEGWLPED